MKIILLLIKNRWNTIKEKLLWILYFLLNLLNSGENDSNNKSIFKYDIIGIIKIFYSLKNKLWK